MLTNLQISDDSATGPLDVAFSQVTLAQADYPDERSDWESGRPGTLILACKYHSDPNIYRTVTI